MISAFGVNHGSPVSKAGAGLLTRNSKDIVLPASIGTAGMGAAAASGHHTAKGKSEHADAKRAAGYSAAAGAASVAGHTAYRAAGLTIRAKGVKAERTLPEGMSRSQRTKIERDHRKKFGLSQGDKAGMKKNPAYFRTYPKELPGWKYKRALGAISGRREHGLGAVASAVPVAAVVAHSRKRDVAKSAFGVDHAVAKAGRTATVEAVRWGSGLTAVGTGTGGAVYAVESKRTGQRDRTGAKTAAATGLGAVAGQGVYQAAGYGAKHAALPKERTVTRAQRDKALKPVKRKHGAYTASMERHYPKQIPGWRTHRALGVTHRGKVGTATGAAVTAAGGLAAYEASNRRNK